MKLIRKYEKEFSETRPLGFEILIEKRRGVPTTYCRLDEEQATFFSLWGSPARKLPVSKKLTLMPSTKWSVPDNLTKMRDSRQVGEPLPLLS